MRMMYGHRPTVRAYLAGLAAMVQVRDDFAMGWCCVLRASDDIRQQYRVPVLAVLPCHHRSDPLFRQRQWHLRLGPIGLTCDILSFAYWPGHRQRERERSRRYHAFSHHGRSEEHTSELQ